MEGIEYFGFFFSVCGCLVSGDKLSFKARSTRSENSWKNNNQECWKSENSGWFSDQSVVCRVLTPSFNIGSARSGPLCSQLYTCNERSQTNSGHSIWPKQAPPPSNHCNKEERVTSPFTSAWLSPVQTRKKKCKSYNYSLSHILNTLLHLLPCLLLGAENQKMCQKL